MLPIATPPNAIVFGSKYLKIKDMILPGLILNILGIILVTLVMYFWGTYVFDIDYYEDPQYLIKIPNPTTYTNKSANQQIIYVRVTNNNPNKNKKTHRRNLLLCSTYVHHCLTCPNCLLFEIANEPIQNFLGVDCHSCFFKPLHAFSDENLSAHFNQSREKFLRLPTSSCSFGAFGLLVAL